MEPFTGMFRGLPLGRHISPSCLSIGFGWDSISDDYKVLTIGSSYEDGKLRRTWSKGFAYWFAENVFESDRISLVASFDMRMGGAKAGSGARFFCRAAE
ncbi:Hypothetical predicted protein [Olea europaea subsp. europaea]|uniref:Uncharacterized protein n=1 Tax=Olea europaea subsp. europaea TaxID=158383 RepID=A0A8S0TIJ9_OLEEU|nr:Hypothetical predicted protein [Olea europaea subsp. europaea]